MTGYGSAPGKVILTGEHSVVYGYPAIACAISLRCQVVTTSNNSGLEIESKELNLNHIYSHDDLIRLLNGDAVYPKFDNIVFGILQLKKPEELNVKLQISSDIPIGAGLGSSAAVSVASICSIADYFDLKLSDEQLNSDAFKAEQIAHGTPSGIDNTVASKGGLIYFEKGKISHNKLVSQIPILIVNTQIPRNTKTLVTAVRNKKEKYPSIFNPILDAMGNLSLEFQSMLGQGKIHEMGELMNLNQSLLDSLGVGHAKITEILEIATNFGSIGGKLTGAGGGGCVIILTSQENQEEIAHALRNKGFQVVSAELSSKGATIGIGD